MKKYWIYKTVYMCPLCGSEKVYRERMYTEKPIEWTERQSLKDHYDYCDV